MCYSLKRGLAFFSLAAFICVVYFVPAARAEKVAEQHVSIDLNPKHLSVEIKTPNEIVPSLMLKRFDTNKNGVLDTKDEKQAFIKAAPKNKALVLVERNGKPCLAQTPVHYSWDDKSDAYIYRAQHPCQGDVESLKLNFDFLKVYCERHFGRQNEFKRFHTYVTVTNEQGQHRSRIKCDHTVLSGKELQFEKQKPDATRQKQIDSFKTMPMPKENAQAKNQQEPLKRERGNIQMAKGDAKPVNSRSEWFQVVAAILAGLIVLSILGVFFSKSRKK